MMGIGFIGAGQVGKALGAYFYEHGLNVLGFYSRNYESAIQGAMLTKSRAYENMSQLITDTEILFLTVPDDQIEKVALRMKEVSLSEGINVEGKMICHTSGVHASTALATLRGSGATVISLHPMLSFSDIDNAKVLLAKTPLTLEGEGPRIDDFKAFLLNNKLSYTEIKAEQKPLYHGAACILSNYLVTLLDIGLMTMEQAGFQREEAKDLIWPLVKGTLQNVDQTGTVKALTGPLARGDVKTIETHLHAMAGEPSTEKIYRLLGQRTLQLVKGQQQINEYTLEKLKEVLLNEKSNHNNCPSDEKK